MNIVIVLDEPPAKLRFPFQTPAWRFRMSVEVVVDLFLVGFVRVVVRFICRKHR